MKQATKDYVIDRAYKASAGVANAVLVTLGLGLCLKRLGNSSAGTAF